MALKPQNLIQAAEADLQRRIHNEHFVPFETYAFHMKHIAHLGDSMPGDTIHKLFDEDLIEQAIRDMLLLALMDYSVRDSREEVKVKGSDLFTENGRRGKVRTVKKNTKAIYDDAAVIVAALRMME